MFGSISRSIHLKHKKRVFIQRTIAAVVGAIAIAALSFLIFGALISNINSSVEEAGGWRNIIVSIGKETKSIYGDIVEEDE